MIEKNEYTEKLRRELQEFILRQKSILDRLQSVEEKLTLLENLDVSPTKNKEKGLYDYQFNLDDINYTIHDVKGNKASIAFSLKSNSPGALLEALNCIANLGLNMSRIESRPSKRELGEYVFFVDVELSRSSNNDHDHLIQVLKPLCEHLVDFGAYPSSEMALD